MTPFVDQRCKTPIEEKQFAADGAICPEQAAKFRQCLDHIDEIEKHKEEIQQKIFRVSDPCSDALDLIRAVPGLDKNPFTAIQILSEIGGDILSSPQISTLFPGRDVVRATFKAISRLNPLGLPVRVPILNQFWCRLQIFN